MPAAFDCSELSKAYGRTVALAGVDLEVEPGELVGLLGPNGAGKSTLVKIACGLVRPSGGAATVAGEPAGSPAARATIGYLAELFRFPEWLRADELLTLHQRLAGSEGGEAERAELLELVGLDRGGGGRVGAMSKGMQQRLGIAQALIGSPRLLMLDEPTSALDPVGRRIVRDLLLELKRRGVAVLLNSHLLSEVERVCDRVAILVGGEIVARGSPAELVPGARRRGGVGSGVRSFPGATREEAPESSPSWSREGERVYGVRVLASTLEDAYLEASGRPRERPTLTLGARLRTAGVSARRVFAVVLILTVAFLALYGVVTERLRLDRRRGVTAGAERTDQVADRIRRCSAWRCSRRCSWARAGRLPDLRRGARGRRARDPAAAGRAAARPRTLLGGRFAAAAGVCAVYSPCLRGRDA